MKQQKQSQIILVNPQDSRNIGAVARAMKTLGYDTLALVQPLDYQIQQASVSACHATDILDTLSIHESLSAAVSHSDEVIGFSARAGRNRFNSIEFDQWLDNMAQQDFTQRSLVFGNERTGLTQKDLTLCRYTVKLPVVNSQPSYNLAQAVLLVIYELHKLNNIKTTATQFPAADWQQYQQLATTADQIARSSGFFRKGSSEVIPKLLPTILRRIQLSRREGQILLGFGNKLLKQLVDK